MTERSRKFDSQLLNTVRRAMDSAREMGHPYATLGHFGINLPKPQIDSLQRHGLDPDHFQDTLPPAVPPGRFDKTRIGMEIETLLASSRRRAEIEGAPTVNLDHAVDAMTDPKDEAYIIELRFLGHFDEPIEVRNMKNQSTEEAA